MRRLKSDVVPILRATARGELESIETPEWDASTCVGVVAAAEGYPGSPRKGDRITGLEAADAVEGAVVFHAGTRRSRSLDGDEDVVTSGGRVLTVTAMGDSAEEARARAYEAYEHIAFDGKFCRTDIGRRREARKQATTGA